MLVGTNHAMVKNEMSPAIIARAVLEHGATKYGLAARRHPGNDFRGAR